MQKASLKSQQGMSAITLMFVLGVAVFFILLGIKMTPVYLQDFSIGEVLQGVEDDPKTEQMSNRELKTLIFKRFNINSVYDFDKKWMKIESTRRGRKITIDYEVREPVIGNVSIIMAFYHQVTVR